MGAIWGMECRGDGAHLSPGEPAAPTLRSLLHRWCNRHLLEDSLQPFVLAIVFWMCATADARYPSIARKQGRRGGEFRRINPLVTATPAAVISGVLGGTPHARHDVGWVSELQGLSSGSGR